jgi:eukaryotic-like serine/threonine-protein kinase
MGPRFVIACLLWQTQLNSQETLHERGTRAYHLGQYATAETFLRQALKVAETDEERASVLSDLGGLFLDAEKLPNAEQTLRQAWAYYERTSDFHSKALVLRHLGAVYASQRRHKESIAALNKALSIARNSRDAPALIADILNTIGVTYLRHRDSKQAASHFQEGLQTLRAAGDNNDGHVTPLLNNLGSLYAQQHKFPLAAELLERAISLTTAQAGPRHQALSFTLDALGFVYDAMGRYDDARARYEEALAILQEHSEFLEVRVARTLRGLALTFAHAGKQHEAELTFARAVSVARRHLTTHPDMAYIFEENAKFLAGMGRTGEAESLSKEVRVARATIANTVNVGASAADDVSL